MLVTSSQLRDDFVRRMNVNPPPDAALPAQFDRLHYSLTRLTALSLPRHTVDTTPQAYFSRTFTVDEIDAAKAHIRKNCLGSASGLDDVSYERVLDIPSDKLRHYFQQCIDDGAAPTELDYRGPRGGKEASQGPRKPGELPCYWTGELSPQGDPHSPYRAAAPCLGGRDWPPPGQPEWFPCRDSDVQQCIRPPRPHPEGSQPREASLDGLPGSRERLSLCQSGLALGQTSPMGSVGSTPRLATVAIWSPGIRRESSGRNDRELRCIGRGDPASPILWILFLSDLALDELPDDITLAVRVVNHLEFGDDSAMMTSSVPAIVSKNTQFRRYCGRSFVEIGDKKWHAAVFGALPKVFPSLFTSTAHDVLKEP